MKVTLHQFSLPLHEPLVTPGGAVPRREGCLIRVEDDDGHVGWGEAAPLPGLPGGSLDEVSDALARWSRRPDRATQSELASVSVAAAAIDTALVTLEAARAGSSLSAHLGGDDVACSIPINALLQGDDPDEIDSAARRAAADGFSTLKLKVGRRSIDDDVARVGAARAAIGAAPALRVDANRSWSVDDARQALTALCPFALEYVEEPTADLAAWPALAAIGVPLAADESLADPGPDEALDLMRQGHIAALIAKIPLLSGVRPALAAAGVASARGAQVVVTSFFDTAVGLAAAAHLAAALGPGHPAAGLATSSLLAADVADPPAVEDGRIQVPTGPGLGITPDLDALTA